MKCTACQNNKCEQKYVNRSKCTGEEEGIECNCICKITAAQEITTSAISIGAGVAAAAGGVMLTMMTGGLFAIVSGAALVGAGSSMVMNPIQKKICGECMTVSDTAQDIALGATIGAITGPIGAGGSALAKGGSGLVKFGIRMGAGAAAGTVSGTVSEVAKIARGEEVSVSSFAKSIAIGAAAGTIGGASTHLASNVSKSVSSEVGKAITRVSVQASSAAATDAGLQLMDKGEVDFKQLAMNTAGQITVATTAEFSQGMAKRTDAYNNKINSERIHEEVDNKKNVKNPDETKAILKGTLKIAKEMPPSKLEEQLKRADAYKVHQQKLVEISNNQDLSHVQREELRRNYIKTNSLPEKKTMIRIKNQIYKLERVGDSNIHKLKDGRAGQYAIDVRGDANGRGAERLIFEERNGKYVVAEYTTDHNYDGTKKDIFIHDPFDALRPEQINRDFEECNEENNDHDGDKKND